jgi:hypothetical protein
MADSQASIGNEPTAAVVHVRAQEAVAIAWRLLVAHGLPEAERHDRG